jgi:hypothetical protein
MNLLKVMTMTLWLSMCFATEKKDVNEKYFEGESESFDAINLSRISSENLFTEQRYNEEKHSEAVPSFEEFLNSLDYDDQEQDNNEKVATKTSEKSTRTDSKETAPKTMEASTQTDSKEIAPKGGCPLCEMVVPKDNCIQCDSCKEIQKAGDKVMGNNDCHCHGRCGTHHCAKCSKVIHGKDLYEGEKIVWERPAGETHVTPIDIDDGLRVTLIKKVPEKCDECQSGQHSDYGHTMHIKENGDAICDECHEQKQAREQQRRKKEIPSKTEKNHGSKRAPKIISFTRKTEKHTEKGPEESIFKKRIIYIIIAVLALVLILGSIACCSTTKPKKRTANRNGRSQIREVKSQTGRIHVIHV